MFPTHSAQFPVQLQWKGVLREDFPLRRKRMWIFYCLTEQDSEITCEPRFLKFTQDKGTVVPVTDCEGNTGLVLLDEKYLGIMICAVGTSAR